MLLISLCMRCDKKIGIGIKFISLLKTNRLKRNPHKIKEIGT